jgi:hypothetical protein
VTFLSPVGSIFRLHRVGQVVQVIYLAEDLLSLLAQKSLQNVRSRKSPVRATAEPEKRTRIRPDFSKMRSNSMNKRYKAVHAYPKISRLFGQQSIFGTADLLPLLWYTFRGNVSDFDALRSQKQGFSDQRWEIYPPNPLSPHAVAEASIRRRILKGSFWSLIRFQQDRSRGFDPQEDTESTLSVTSAVPFSK